MKFLHLVQALALLVLVAGCGGSGPQVDDTTRTRGSSAGFDLLVRQGDDLDRIWQGVGLSDPAGLPTSGRADYAGVMRISANFPGASTDLAGAMDMSVNFANSTLRGGVTSIRDVTGRGYGDLDIDNGSLDRGADSLTEYTFQAELTGTLRAPGANWQVNGFIEGDFHGNAQQAVTGGLGGALTNGANNATLSGDFIAQK